ncbi:MAG: hypothetical protein R3C14_45460 [Caldilineaceae bacterium]
METNNLHLDAAARYRIYAQGRFDPDWLDMLSGAWVIYRRPSDNRSVTILVGEVADQAALMGVLEQLYSLGFPLLLVEYMAGQTMRKA